MEKEVKKQTFRELAQFLRQFWKVMLPFRHLMLLAAAWIFGMQVLGMIEPYMVMYIVNGVQYNHPVVVEHLFLILVATLAAMVLIGLASSRKNRQTIRLLQRVNHSLPIQGVKKFTDLPMSFHEQENPGSLSSNITRGAGNAVNLLGCITWEIGALVFQTIVTVVMMLWVFSLSAAVLVPCVLVFAWLTARVKLRFAIYRKERHKITTQNDRLIGQTAVNIFTVKAFAQEEAELQRIEKNAQRIVAMEDLEFDAYMRTDVVRNGIVSFGRITVLAVCIYAVIGNAIAIGTLMFISTLAERVFAQCYKLTVLIDRIMDSMEPVRALIGLLDEPSPQEDTFLVPLPAHFSGKIHFRDVKFRYESAPEGVYALNGVDLVIMPGETIGIVGETGSGKSTLVKMLMQFYKPVEGNILVDDFNLSLVDSKEIRRRIGYVPQEAEIFSGTIAENITYGLTDVPLEKIIWAATIARIHDFVWELPERYDTKVGERGMRLSGGQRQRLAIARALVRDPDILIFDEGTSHVDVLIEKEIQDALETIRGKRTVIIIAHRLSTIRNANRIVLMEKGRIAEIGNHQDLVNKKGLYSKLHAVHRRVAETL